MSLLQTPASCAFIVVDDFSCCLRDSGWIVQAFQGINRIFSHAGTWLDEVVKDNLAIDILAVKVVILIEHLGG